MEGLKQFDLEQGLGQVVCFLGQVMETISPYMEMASGYIATPYGIAAIAGIVVLSVLLLVFSTQKELSYEDYNKQVTQPQTYTSKAPSTKKSAKKSYSHRRKGKKAKESEEDETAPEAEVEVIAEEIIPVEAAPVKKNKPKKKKVKKEVVEEVAEVEPEEEEVEEVAEEVEVEVPETKALIEDAMIEKVETVVVEKVEKETVSKSAPKPKKAKKKVIMSGNGNEGILQAVDQAALSEDDIQSLMAILKAKQGDDSWGTAGGAGEETKDSLRKKVSEAVARADEMKNDLKGLRIEVQEKSDEKNKLAVENRGMEKKFNKEKETLTREITQLHNVSTDRTKEIARLKKEVEDRDRVNNELHIQLTQLRQNAQAAQQVVELQNEVAHLQEELQESKEQYSDLERNISQINILEKSLLNQKQEMKEKESLVAEQISSIHELEAENEKLKNTVPTMDNSALTDAESTVVALRTELEQLQGSLSSLEQLQVENEMLKSEVNVLKDSGLSEKLDAAMSEIEQLKSKSDSDEEKVETVDVKESEIIDEQAVQSSPNDFDVAVLEAKLSEVEGKNSEVEARAAAAEGELAVLRVKLAESEKAASDAGSHDSVVDVSNELVEQLEQQKVESEARAVEAEAQYITIATLQKTTADEKVVVEEELASLKAKFAELENAPVSEGSSAGSQESAVDVSAEIAEQLQLAESQLSSVKTEQDELTAKLAVMTEQRDAFEAKVSALEEQVLESASADSPVPSADTDELMEKLQQAVAAKDAAVSESARFQEILSKTEGLLAQLQSKFEEDIPKWSKDLEEKTKEAEIKSEELEKTQAKVTELEAQLGAGPVEPVIDTSRVTELEASLNESTIKLAETEAQLASEKRWHSETLVKMKEAEAQASQAPNMNGEVEQLQKANEMEAKWHAQTLTQLQQANTDVSALQDKLSSKNSDIVQLISSNEELKQKVDELSCGNNSSEVKDLQSKLDQAVVIATRVHELQDEVKDLKDSSEESQTAQANQTADKKFTPI